jgi:hypothetical protein
MIGPIFRIFWMIMSNFINIYVDLLKVCYAGVAKPGQRREIFYIHDAQKPGGLRYLIS